MEGLRQYLKEAKKELAKKIEIPPGVKQESSLEIAEIKALEEKLKKIIEKSEAMLKQNSTEI
jgi:hypothetical protein